MSVSMENSTASLQWAMATVPKPGAMISISVSIFVLYHIYTTELRLNRLYHRIIAAMNVNCIFSSIAMLIGTWAMPNDTEHSIGASGNHSTCCIQGLLFCQGLATLIYYCLLSLYAFICVRDDFNLGKLKKTEFLLHFFANGLPLLLSIYAVVNDLLKPGRSFCVIEARENSTSCLGNSEVACDSIYRTGNPRDLVWLGIFIVYSSLILLTVFFALMMIYVEEKKSRSNQYFEGKRKYIENFRKRKAGLIRKQSLFYLFACFLVHILGGGLFITYIKFGSTNMPLYFISIVIYSFQGLIFGVVYFSLLTQNDLNLFCGTLFFRMNMNKSVVILETPNTDPSQDSGKGVLRNTLRLSIFDEKTEHEKFTAFGIYIGGIDSDEDSDSYDFKSDYVDDTIEVVDSIKLQDVEMDV